MGGESRSGRGGEVAEDIMPRMADLQLENVEKLGDVPRPDRGGTLGRKTVIRVNHFLAKVSLPEIYHYRVSEAVQHMGFELTRV